MLRQFKFKVLCEDVLTSNIVVENQALLKRLKISDNNSKISVAFAQSISTYENIHNLNQLAHKILFDKVNDDIDLLKQKDSAIDDSITTKADITSVPTSLSQLENDEHFINDVSGKADISLCNLTAEGLDVIKSQIPQIKLNPFCINSSSIDFNGNPTALGGVGNNVTLADMLFTTAKGDLLELKDIPAKSISVKKYTNIASFENAISSGAYIGYPLQYAFDGNLSTYYATSTSAINTTYIGQKNLTQNIQKIKLYVADYASLGSCTLQYSQDGINWLDIQDVSLGTSYPAWKVIDVPTYPLAPYFRLFNLYRIDKSSYSTNIHELLFLVEDENGLISIDEKRFVCVDKNSIITMASSIYKQAKAPSNPSLDDVWLNTSIEPLASYIYDGTSWLEYEGVPVGFVSLSAGGIILSVETFEYNTNGYFDKNSWLKSHPNYLKEISLQSGVLWIASMNGWIQNGASKYLSPVAPISKGERFIPNSASFKFYPCKY